MQNLAQKKRFDNAYLAGYRVGSTTIQIWRSKGWAIGKGKVKKEISNWIRSHTYYPLRDADRGFIDALLDSVN